MPRTIDQVHEDRNYQIVGMCEGRRVQYTFSVFAWFFVDTREWIDGPLNIIHA